MDRIEQWSDRLRFECIGKRNTFLTLTYSDETLPADGGLHKDELQKYFKRLRRLYEIEGKERKFKYYASGEYGDKFGRPHYHAILCGIDPHEDAIELQKAWGKGRIKAEPPRNGAIRYLMKYIEKQTSKERSKEIYGELEPPFALMSKGIGRKWIEDKLEYIVENGGYYNKGKIKPLNEYYRRILRQNNFDLKQIKEKVRKWHENGGVNYEQYIKSIGYLREKHLIQQARSRNQPMEDYYLSTYQPPTYYIQMANEAKEIFK